MTSQGQRFRRRALRRGYKVDEVDAFLDRVEATLAGDAVGPPMTTQDVHDVVFRVRFGGYDEWQVDLHLDRVERQLTELEERGPVYQRGPERGLPMRDDRLMPPMRGERPMPPRRDERLPMRDERPPMREERPMPPRDGRGYPPVEDFPTQSFPGPREPRSAPPARIPTPPPPARGPRPEPATYGGFEPGRHGRMDMTAEIRAVDSAYTPDDIAHVDALRRGFAPRRFGSGYDPMQVDRLFDAVISAMTGRSAVPITDGELDPGQFSLVQGGYYEADVDAALQDIRGLLARRR